MAKTQARVLFANFPQRVERIMPNNVAINGGLSLTIFLDFIPLGLPEDELVVKFTCVRQLPARSVGTSASDRHSDCLSVSKSPASSPPFTPRRSSYVPLRDAVESPPRRRAVIAVEATSPKDESGREHAGKRAPETLAVQCISPALDEMVLEDFETFVDVALNGIHFTGQPHRLRVVDIKVMGVVPSVGSSDRATKVYIQASECFESDDTSVLLRYSDDTEEILPAHLDAATQQVYFFLPPQKALNHAAIGQVADDLPADNGSHRLTQWSGNMETQPGEKPRSIKNESSNSSELVTGTSQSGSASSCTPEGEALPSETDTTNQVSVFLSFNRQVFSQNAAIFTYYRSDLTTASVLAYTVSETGELFEADLEGTLAPQTHLVVYLQSGIATNSAKVRLTLLHPSPAASAFLASCAQDELLPNQAQSRALMPGGETVCQSPHGMTDGALGVATSADDAPEIPHEAVAKVIYLDADVVLNREPLMLLPDPSRTKKKTGVPRGGAGDGQRGKAGMPQGTKNKSGGKATTPGGGSAVAAGPAGNAGSERGEAKGGGGANNRDFGRGGVPSGGAGGATAKTKKSEKSDGTSPDNADENRNNSSLEVVTPSLSLPPLTPEEEQQAVPDDTVLAAFDISLDGQRFIRVKEARILRLQCKSVWFAKQPAPGTSGRGYS
ncbi:hypothetical protein CSUI_005147 [Cystoisospora suis]|uniref:Uncharacterized protein n=1 Tax=Cystoisospora suis TaxID=483139 RepID=A0A2C6KYI0_9APIC|nr:hypothetical protein CSUI_005147 [Cystoisospora suis]